MPRYLLMAMRNLLSPNTLPSLANPKACDGVTLTNSLVPSRNICCPVKTNLWWSVISTPKAPHQLRHSGVEAPIVRPDHLSLWRHHGRLYWDWNTFDETYFFLLKSSIQNLRILNFCKMSAVAPFSAPLPNYVDVQYVLSDDDGLDDKMVVMSNMRGDCQCLWLWKKIGVNHSSKLKCRHHAHNLPVRAIKPPQ